MSVAQRQSTGSILPDSSPAHAGRWRRIIVIQGVAGSSPAGHPVPPFDGEGWTSETWRPVAQPGGAPAKLLPDSLPASRGPKAEDHREPVDAGSSPAGHPVSPFDRDGQDQRDVEAQPGPGGRRKYFLPGFLARAGGPMVEGDRGRWRVRVPWRLPSRTLEMGTVAQLDRALALAAPSSGLAPGRWLRVIDCNSRGCGFESRQSPCSTDCRAGAGGPLAVGYRSNTPPGVTGNMRPRGRRGPFVRPRGRGSTAATVDEHRCRRGRRWRKLLSHASPVTRTGRRKRVIRSRCGVKPVLPPAFACTTHDRARIVPPGRPHHAQPWKGGG